ncbi:hypothetical protein OHA72_59655 [Dactylosporangium sp. NBC_01737]|uniref:hypothetical protein n=1 Tax=Dactylosporangium sp. NBC_01737 TaxID=2975959 RepID=UPI002E0EDBBD|nr:hypothetical protein OHA72_59655 [Dactylosporangium sp. NBC_01737]
MLVAPAKAGPLRRADDAATVSVELERQRVAGVAEPYAAVYELALDPRQRVVVTGQIGQRFTEEGPRWSVEMWLAAKDPERSITAAWPGELVQVDPPAFGGVALCRDATGPGVTAQDPAGAWCAWAAGGIIVEFVFARTPASAARDRVAQLLPDLVTRA